MKLNVLLAKTEQAAAVFKSEVKKLSAFFKEQKGFVGFKRTYAAREGTIDEPTKRGTIMVVSTVDEKLKELEKNSLAYINNLFAVEATNASGTARAELKVDGVSFGLVSSSELMRLKGILESGDIEEMYSNIPVRNEAEEWTKTDQDSYKDREVYELPKRSGVYKSIVKREYIMEDPNIEKLEGKVYVPTKGVKDEIIELGDYTAQQFSGEAQERAKSELFTRKQKFLNAVVEALKIANEVETVQSNLTAEKIFGYLHRGK